jgi:16S rRNA (cytosine967-C5)-methyltransferase
VGDAGKKQDGGLKASATKGVQTGPSVARRIAFDVLLRVETAGAYSDELLHEQLKQNISSADAALATELTLGSLRRQRTLDWLIGRLLPSPKDRNLRSSTPVERLDAEVLISLRLGLYQLRFLERVPARAAVSESVELVKRARKTSATGLVNAVLRRAAEEAARGVAIDALVPNDLAPADRLGVLHSHPTWLVERWLGGYGREKTVALLEADNRAPRISAAVLDRARRGDVIQSLEKAGLEVQPGRLLRDALSLSGGSPSHTEAFERGEIILLDEASQAVAALLGVRAGDSVLDLCAAPGGKTALLATAAGAGATVVACDLHARRLRTLAALMKRIGATQVRGVVLDGTAPLPFARQFRRILVDAPCSGTGTLARHPEIRWRIKAEDFPELRARQIRLLRNALPFVEPGGRLVYSTCSMEAEENEQVVQEALGGFRGFRICRAGTVMAPLLASGVSAEAITGSDGTLRTSPATTHTDGFYAALIQVS